MTESALELVALAERFADMARSLAAADGEQATLQQVVELAVAELRGCEYAGISYVEGRTITSPASTGAIPRIVDLIQSSTGEGPCLDAIRDHEVHQTDDLMVEPLWPRFAARAHAETGIRSILSVRLFLAGATLGSLNMYARQPAAFDDTDVALAIVFAAHAAVAVAAARHQHQLEMKAETRDIIGRAKGVLMARSHLSDEQAFDLLRRASQRSNVKLREVAQQVVDGRPPPAPA